MTGKQNMGTITVVMLIHNLLDFEIVHCLAFNPNYKIELKKLANLLPPSWKLHNANKVIVKCVYFC